MYKKYKRLVYTPPDFVKQTCRKQKIRSDLFSKNFFPGLIYCHQEPLWLLNVIEDDCYFLGLHIRLSAIMALDSI